MCHACRRSVVRVAGGARLADMARDNSGHEASFENKPPTQKRQDGLFCIYCIIHCDCQFASWSLYTPLRTLPRGVCRPLYSACNPTKQDRTLQIRRCHYCGSFLDPLHASPTSENSLALSASLYPFAPMPAKHGNSTSDAKGGTLRSIPIPHPNDNTVAANKVPQTINITAYSVPHLL